MEGAIDAFRATFRENPITLVGGSWALLVGGTLLYVKQKKIPLQLKIIQARMVAQGALLTGCVRPPPLLLPIFPLRSPTSLFFFPASLPRTAGHCCSALLHLRPAQEEGRARKVHSLRAVRGGASGGSRGGCRKAQLARAERV